MMVLPESRGSRRTRLSNMQPWLPRLLMVPDWWKSKCGGRMVMPYLSTPPFLGFGWGAASWNFEPSNSMGTPSAMAGHGMPYRVAAAAAPLTNSRRFTPLRLDLDSRIAVPPIALLAFGLLQTEHDVLRWLAHLLWA